MATIQVWECDAVDCEAITRSVDAEGKWWHFEGNVTLNNDTTKDVQVDACSPSHLSAAVTRALHLAMLGIQEGV